MNPLALARCVLVPIILLSFIFTFVAIAKSPSGADVLAAEGQAPASALVMFCIANKKALIAGLAISSVALLGTYYNEIAGLFREHIRQKTIKPFEPPTDNGAPGPNPTPTPNPLVIPDKNITPAANPMDLLNQPVDQNLASLLTSQSEWDNDSGMSNAADGFVQGSGKGLISRALGFIGGLIFTVGRQAALGVASLVLSDEGYINGYDKQSLLNNPILQNPHDSANFSVRNIVNLGLSAASVIGIKNAPLRAFAWVNNEILHPKASANEQEHEERQGVIKYMMSVVQRSFAPESFIPEAMVSNFKESMRQSLARSGFYSNHHATTTENNSNDTVLESAIDDHQSAAHGQSAASYAGNSYVAQSYHSAGQSAPSAKQSSNNAYSAEEHLDRYGGFLVI